jgi:energy-coupling factor transporter transmembrane protein EcfT
MECLKSAPEALVNKTLIIIIIVIIITILCFREDWFGRKKMLVAQFVVCLFFIYIVYNYLIFINYGIIGKIFFKKK